MLADMKAYGYLKPGQNGTKRLVEHYGSAPCSAFAIGSMKPVE